MKKTKSIAIIAGFAALAISLIVSFHPAAHATTATNSIMKKAMLEGVYKAYSTQHVASDFTYRNYYSFDSTILKNASTDGQVGFPNVYNDLNDSDVSYKQLFMGYDTYGATGKNRFPGVFSELKGSEPASSIGGGSYEWKDQFIQGMGYEITNEEELSKMEGEYCVSVYYTWSSYGVFESDRNGEEASHYLCAKVSGNDGDDIEDAIIADHPYVKYKTGGTDVIEWEVHQNTHKVEIDCATMSQYWVSGSSIFGSIFGANSLVNLIANGEAQDPFRFIGDGTCTDSEVEYIIGTTKWVDLRSELIQVLISQGSSFKISGTRLFLDLIGISSYTVQFSIGSRNYHQDDPRPLGFLYDELDSKVLMYEYGIPNGNYTGAAAKAIKYLTGASSFSYDNTSTGTKLTDEEVFILYDKYIKQFYGIKREKSPDSTTGTADYLHVRLINDSTGDVEEKYVQVKNENDKVYGVYESTSGSNYKNHFATKINAAAVANHLLNATNITHVDPSKLAEFDATSTALTGDKDEDEDGEEGDTEDDCYTNAGSLGWIVCPLILTGGDMVQTTYEGVVVPFLRIDPKLFRQTFEDYEGDLVEGGTFKAWAIFRDVANVAFVIMFLVVIFSQLTGFGIDNYGIKKILPKLIITAILINMSYVVCQLAIDVANIVGGTIGQLFAGLGNEILSSAPNACGDACVTTSTPGGANVAFYAIIAVVVAITAGAVVAIGPQILIPVLLAILSFVIAVFFLLVILGIRQALAVLLVVASPVAFLMYTLPNTKKIFDKWFTTLKGVLLAYPICSALVYGGDMVAKIILAAYGTSATDFASLTPILSAGIIAVAPIFLIPGVIKKSMGSMEGMINRVTSGASRKAHQRASGALNRSGLNNPERGLVTGAMMRRQRYNAKAREDMKNARQGEYNRKRSDRVLNGSDYWRNSKLGKSALGQKMGIGRGLADKDYSKMSAAQQREFNAAHGAIAAYDKEMMSGYQAQVENMDVNGASEMLRNSIDGDNIDMNMAEVAMKHIGKLDQGKLLEELQTFTSSNAFKKMDTAQRNRMISSLAGQSGNTVAQAYSKVLGTDPGKSLGDAIAGGDISSKIGDMDKNIVTNTDKDVMSFMAGNNLANAFTSEQMSVAMSSGNISGKNEAQFNKVIENRDAVKVKADLDKLTTEQFATTNDSSLESAKKVIGAHEVYNIANGHMRNLQKPGNEQLLQKVSRDKFKYS